MVVIGWICVLVACSFWAGFNFGALFGAMNAARARDDQQVDDRERL